MENRGIKRKRYEVIKNDLSVELHKLTLGSGSFNEEVRAATEDFEQFCKSMSDRQDYLKSESLVLDEQYRTTLAVLEGDDSDTGGDSSGENIVLPQTYAGDISRFVNDASTSLKGHGEILKKEYEEMEIIFKKYEKLLKDNLEDLKAREEQIDKARSKLSTALHVFGRYVPEDSEESEG